MSDNITLNAEPRSDSGKGASRRLRHKGLVPAIVYGGKFDPVQVSVDHNVLTAVGMYFSNPKIRDIYGPRAVFRPRLNFRSDHSASTMTSQLKVWALTDPCSTMS